MKKIHLLTISGLLAVALTAVASSDYWLVRDSQLRSKPVFNSAGSPVSQGTSVTVVKRSGVWRQVQVGGKKGWMPSYELRQSAGAVTKKQDSSVLGMLMRSTSRLFGRSASNDVERGVVATIGVRGLSEEDLKKSKPNYKAVDQMKAWVSTAKTARKAAGNAGLTAAKVAELKGAK